MNLDLDGFQNGEYIRFVTSDFIVASTRQSRLALFDACGAPVSSPPEKLNPILVDIDENIVAVDAEERTAVVSPRTGEILHLSEEVLRPIAVGADGTLYTLRSETDESENVESELVALSPSLEVRWRLSLGEGQATSTLLDEDGSLYISLSGEKPRLIKVRTQSPGLADTTWPAVAGDIRGTRSIRMSARP